MNKQGRELTGALSIAGGGRGVRMTVEVGQKGPCGIVYLLPPSLETECTSIHSPRIQPRDGRRKIYEYSTNMQIIAAF